MKRIKLLLIGILAAVPILTGVSVAQAHSFHSGDNVTISRNETVDHTIFAAGRTIDIAGKVNGDVFCAGQNITLSGTITGDVICAGQNVRIAGQVNGDVRVAGQNVTVGGTITRNLSAAGQTVSLEAGAKVSGDVSIGGQDATLNGAVGRDLAIGSTTATLNSIIGRDVQSAGQNLTLGSDAKVAGNITYTSKNTLDRGEGSQVAGKITRNEPKQREQGNRIGSIIRMSVWAALYMLIALMLAAVVLVLVMPRVFHSATDVAVKRPGKTLLVGFIASLVMPIVIALLMFSIIGIPLGILVLVGWLFASLLASTFSAYYVGRLLLSDATNAVGIMALGTLVLLLLYFVPILGAIVWIFALWFGLGTILLQANRLPKPRYNIAAIEASPVTKAKKK